MSDRNEWGPTGGLVVVLWMAAAAATGWCVLLVTSGADRPGLLIAGSAAVGLLVAAAYATRARPRLRADADGLTVGGLLRPRHHPWPLVQDVRLVPTRRLGRESTLLEIDTATADGGERLLLFGRLDLGADPHDVAARLLDLRPHRSG